MDMIVKSESLTSVADAIREKGGTSEQLVFPDDFATAIMAIQSGGVSPQLIITAPAGSTITAVNGDDTVTGVVGTEGTLALDLPAFGTWTVTATLDGQEASTSVYIEQEYPIELQYGVTFQVSGGHGETITAYVDDVEIGSVTLDSTGEGTVFLEGVNGKTVKFVGGLSGYAKTVQVVDVNEMVVNVYPDDALYWHGRTFDEVTGGWNATNSEGLLTGNFPKGVTGNSYYAFTNKNAIHLSKSKYDTLYVNVAFKTTAITSWFLGVFTQAANGTTIAPVAVKRNDYMPLGVNDVDISGLDDGMYYIGFGIHRQTDSATSAAVEFSVSEIHLE